MSGDEVSGPASEGGLEPEDLIQEEDEDLGGQSDDSDVQIIAQACRCC